MRMKLYSYCVRNVWQLSSKMYRNGAIPFQATLFFEYEGLSAYRSFYTENIGQFVTYLNEVY